MNSESWNAATRHRFEGAFNCSKKFQRLGIDVAGGRMLILGMKEALYFLAGVGVEVGVRGWSWTKITNL